LLEGLDVHRVRNPQEVSTDTSQIRRVRRALDQASAMETVEGLAEGLQETVAERGRSFSGGQRQRLSLARALLADAEVLVLIEPTSAVDAHTESQIAESLREAREGRTTVVVSASPLLLDKMDVIQVMRSGRVMGIGTHATLMRQDDAVGALYRSVVARTMSAAEPAEGEHIDDASTGAIDTLWHQAEHTGAIPNVGTENARGVTDAAAHR
jgi:ABC-type multidrug transport system fused ATPase/permease subunit